MTLGTKNRVMQEISLNIRHFSFSQEQLHGNSMDTNGITKDRFRSPLANQVEKEKLLIHTKKKGIPSKEHGTRVCCMEKVST